MFFEILLILLMVLLSPLILLLILILFLFDLYQRIRAVLTGPVSVEDLERSGEIGRYYIVRDKGELQRLAPKRNFSTVVETWIFVSEDGSRIFLNRDKHHLRNQEIIIKGFWRMNVYDENVYLEVC